MKISTTTPTPPTHLPRLNKFVISKDIKKLSLDIVKYIKILFVDIVKTDQQYFVHLFHILLAMANFTLGWISADKEDNSTF